jgi:membrane AbrB-like protein
MAIALAAGFGGALIALVLGLPAAALLGSTFAVTVVALLRLRPAVPNLLRDIGFCVIGVSLGSGVTPDIWSDIARWPLSIAMLALTVLAVLLACGLVLKTMFGSDTPTAMLATSPGALSYTLALATSRGADVRFVMVLQSLRLLLITMLLPPLIGYAGGLGDAPHVNLPHLGYGEGAILLAGTFALGTVMARLRSPAPFILAGLVVSGFAHGAGLVSGRLADMVTFFGFSITGTFIGARFAGITGGELKRLALAGTVSTTVAVSISMVGAWTVSTLLDLPFGQTWVSFAPGGVEGMSSMALALGYDPVYVATHHVFRILLLIAVLPLLLGLFSGKGK